MSNYSYYYVKVIDDGTNKAKTYKFLKGNPTLFKPPEDTWSTYGRYNLLSRLLRGGLSGSGDIYHPANAIFKLIYSKTFHGVNNTANEMNSAKARMK
ncbi:hypothetical protein APICC_07052 [Apis cerana cerana]|uniref:Uncharacterized protein n=1 Tax=Apis cerana cerana TaxID=94128 RepID=A0A2A3EBF8_APICC|nr:hypothetical protein APICC_07052 [Apis cerana cerana]